NKLVGSAADAVHANSKSVNSLAGLLMSRIPKQSARSSSRNIQAAPAIQRKAASNQRQKKRIFGCMSEERRRTFLNQPHFAPVHPQGDVTVITKFRFWYRLLKRYGDFHARPATLFPILDKACFGFVSVATRPLVVTPGRSPTTKFATVADLKKTVIDQNQRS